MKLLLYIAIMIVADAGFAVSVFEDTGTFSIYGGVNLQYGRVAQWLFSASESNNVFSADSNAHFLYYQEIQDGIFIGADLAIKTLYNSKYTGSYKSAHNAAGDPIGDVHDNGAYLFLKSAKCGIVEFGFAKVADYILKINSSVVSVAAGGVGGDWTNYANLRGSRFVHHGAGYDPKHSIFWTKPRLYNQYVGVNSLLVSYYSPKISGFEIAYSYLPKSSDDVRSSMGGGIRYENLGYSISLTAEFLPANATNSDSQVFAWALGALYSYGQLSMAASHGNIYGKDIVNHLPHSSLFASEKFNESARYWDAGLSYAVGNWKASSSYFASYSDNYNLSAIAFGVENFFTSNASYYAEIVGFKARELTFPSNSGFVLLSGLKLGF